MGIHELMSCYRLTFLHIISIDTLEWAVQGCFKEAKNPKRKAMGVVYKRVENDTKYVARVVEACMREAEKEGLEIFGINNSKECVTTKDSSYDRYGRSENCKVYGQYGVGSQRANFVYKLSMELYWLIKTCKYQLTIAGTPVR